MLSSHALKLISEAEAINAEDAAAAGAIGFMARGLVQATLPHRDPGADRFVRVNGNYTLSMTATVPGRGLPYGTKPRILLAWIATEAVRTKNRNVYVGGNLSEFLKKLGYAPTGGRNGTLTLFREQTRRLSTTTITSLLTEEHGEWVRNYQIVDSALTIFESRKAAGGKWESTVTLGESFFNDIVDRPVPIDMRVLKALSRSPMAMDIYSWLTYRLSYLRRISPPIPWEGLALQFGCDYSAINSFERAFRRELHKVLTFWPAAAAATKTTKEGLILLPGKSGPHVARKVAHKLS